MTNQWEVENLRLTVFPTPNQQFTNSANWWEGVAGSDPETISQQPKNALTQYSGPFGDNAKLTLTIRPDRIDWLLTVNDTQLETEFFPIIATIEKVLPPILSALENWLVHECPPCLRIGWGAVLLLPVRDKVEGYNRIGEYLPEVKLDAENSTDFTYSINRPRKSKLVNDVTINRLSRWSVINIKRFQLPGLVNNQFPAPILEERHACRLEMDVNSSQECQKQFSKEEILNITNELVSLADEIAKNGDIK